MQQVHLRPINKCTPEQQQAVRDVRNQPGVRRYMYTDHEISPDEHLGWLKKLETDDRQLVFVVLLDEAVTGLVSINALDRLHKKADWAFYLKETMRGGLGATLECALLDFAFDSLALEKLNCEVIETNEAVVKMHQKFGFVQEGLRRSNIEKEGARIGVVLLGITRQEWHEQRAAVLEKYEKLIEKFPISIEYDHA